MVLAPGFTHTEFHERAGIENTRGMPEFLWPSTDEVVGAALSVYDRGRAVCGPGAINTVAAAFSATMPRRGWLARSPGWSPGASPDV
jgi:short-subunit dehydrogenase